MNSKALDKYSSILDHFKTETGWNKARIKLLISLLCALMKVQTVSFPKLAQAIEGPASVDSKLRRIQRFFAEFVLDQDIVTKLIFALLPGKAPFALAMDRTNWEFGQTQINILIISVCYHGVGIPLLWQMLPKAGNSNQGERNKLLGRYIALFGTDSIASFTADREFVGGFWFAELISQRIPFYIRIKENMWVDKPGEGKSKVFWFFNALPVNELYQHPKIIKLGQHYVYLSGMRMVDKKTGKIEFLIIASFNLQADVLAVYKERWQIETMFKAMKSSGFNIEDTHLNELERISKLIAIVALAFVWAYKVGIYRDGLKPIKVKKHGRRQYSFFKYGLIFLAHLLLNPLNDDELSRCFNFLSCT